MTLISGSSEATPGGGAPAAVLTLAPGETRRFTVDLAPLAAAGARGGTLRVRAVYFSDGAEATWAGRVASNEIGVTLTLAEPGAPQRDGGQ